jgi:hypothetical protein
MSPPGCGRSQDRATGQRRGRETRAERVFGAKRALGEWVAAGIKLIAHHRQIPALDLLFWRDNTAKAANRDRSIPGRSVYS